MKIDTYPARIARPLLLVALGSDLRRNIAHRDVDIFLLRTILDMGADPNETIEDRNFGLYVIDFNEIDNSSDDDARPETVWQTFLRHLIFRRSAGGRYTQPHAADAIRHMVKFGADLDTNVHLTRVNLRDEAAFITLRCPWREGEAIPVLEVLAFLQVDGFQAVHERIQTE